MRIVFMGTPDFSVTVLDALVNAGHEIAAVYSQPPRPAGRGKKDRPSPVHKRAEQLGFEVRTPHNFKSDTDREAFAALNADIGVVVAYGLILPQAILDTPTHGCLNIHASLLPRWRGAAPIQRAIMAGDSETGVCIMQMEAGLDTGPVLLRKSIPVEASDTYATLHDRLSGLGAKAITTTLAQLDGLVAKPQPENDVTYASKIDKSEARIDWTLSAVEIDRLIRGISPFPGAWFEFDGERIKALHSQFVEGNGAPGLALDDNLTIACGAGAIQITMAQKAGKAVQQSEIFLRGVPISAGNILT